jgi:putative nucleotidyltransferase-like protein
MKSASVSGPPLPEIAAALRETTEVLARELAAPSASAPPWNDFEWHIARAVTAMHGVSSLILHAQRWAGPESWRRFLSGQRDHAIGRYRQIACVLESIDSRARGEGIAFVALKGAALHARNLYAAGGRPMGDIDLLICGADANSLARVLEDCGYRAAFTTHRHEVFQPRVKKVLTGPRLGEHVDNPINIEVHTRIAERLPVHEIDITQFLIPGSPQPGLNAYPTAASLMLHLLLHAAGNMRARALRLIQLHDIALLAARFTAADWQELLALRPNGCKVWWALAPLTLAARYYPSAIPPEVPAQLSAECPWLLVRLTRRQRLADVSWSNIRIQAFPGVEWSRSPQEALKFMSSRVWPSQEDLLELSIGAAEIPGSAAIPWYGSSHAARIARWIFSRPPRVQTLLSVQAALAQEP